MLQRELTTLEEWAQSNRRDAMWEGARFWALKLPAIAGAVTTGIFGYVGWELAGLILGAVAAACIAVDALNPAARLRDAHLRAVHDLVNLQQAIAGAWDIAAWEAKTEDARQALAAQILKDTRPERDRIAKTLRDAETKLSASVTGSSNP